MARTAVLGLPRIGPDRELKFALEAFWAGRIERESLLQTARELRAAGWQRARAAGIDVIPSGDHSLYDHVLDTAWALGAVALDRADPAAYFALARGTATQRPLVMTKWFDTNYHYLVPEPGQGFVLRADHWIEPLGESAALGIATRPVVLGPVTFLSLCDRLDLLDELLPVYLQLVTELLGAGAQEIQIDEPWLVLDHPSAQLDAFTRIWSQLTHAAPGRLCLATYFSGMRVDTLARVATPCTGEVHLDLVRGLEQLEPAVELLRDSETRLSLGVIDGRNVWRCDPDAALAAIDTAVAVLGDERVTIAPSCSLLHVPHSAARETAVDGEVRPWLAFCEEKLAELALLREAAGASPAQRDELLAQARGRVAARRASAHTNDAAVRTRVAQLGAGHYERPAPAAERRVAQRQRVTLPLLPTTTIGSFPQTEEIRAARRELREGRIDEDAYERFIEREIAHAIERQEELGLDVLVHGEPERNDMVEYFGQQLNGFAFTAHGWVQSYGSRCVKPPILYGDVSRPQAMTVRWWRHAQALTAKPVKGMLTGPVTILQWSFVRDDQPRRETCTQIALAISDEVRDLEAAGAFAIQVDEAALREGLPLHRDEQDAYVQWAVDCFRLTVARAAADTQIHTHMCYSHFDDIIDHIVRLDADVLSIEASRSDMHVLEAFAQRPDYTNQVGPGVYDIHSPRIPSQGEIEQLLELAQLRLGRERLWVNPDCGLKTRRWDEVLPALANMVAAAGALRRAAEPATV